VKFSIPPTSLPSGYYWLSVQTAPGAFEPGFTVRTFRADGGGFLRNCDDAFADGPNPDFLNKDGELQGGPGTLSVYATYTAH
jgi:hypothetical protein